MRKRDTDSSDRILVVAPTSSDARLTSSHLKDAGLVPEIVENLDCVTPEDLGDYGAVVMTDDVLAGTSLSRFVSVLRTQPAWSDLPVILLCREGADSQSAAWAMDLFANITVLERPVRISTLVSALRTALRARGRQYEIRDLLAEIGRSEQQLRLVIDTIPAVVCYVGPDHKYRFVNQRLIEWFNLGPEAVRGHHLSEVLGEKAYELIKPKVQIALSGKPVFFEAEMPYQHGRARTVEVNYVPDFRSDGQVAGFVALINDVSARKEAEEELASITRESDKRRRLHETIMASTPDLVYVLQRDHRFSYANDALLKMLDKSWEAIYGKTFRELGYEPWQAAMHENEIDQAIASRRPVKGELTYTNKGRERHYEHIFVPVLRADGEVEAVVGTTRDITDRKEAENALRENEKRLRDLSDSLEQRVAERTHELHGQTLRLRHMATELASAEHRERKRLAAVLHDELQQLLVAAKMQLNITRGRIDDDKAQSAIDGALSRLKEAVAVARDLTRQLRPPVLYEAGLLPALKWLAQQTEERYDLVVAVDAGEVAQTLNDDIKVLLFECVRELIMNAHKYAQVEVIRLEATEADGELCLAVEDRGNGFDVDTITMRQGGGFGLFSIRERLAALGGTMNIQSAPGKGTRVELMIPVPEADESQSDGLETDTLRRAGERRDGRKAVSNDHRARVLVVDDHALVREGIANILDADDRLNVVGEASDGIEAIKAVEQLQPDVVLVDVNMPRMNGVEATREIHRRWPNTSIIGLSVQDDEATAQSMRDAGACDFLPKSGDSDRMISTVLRYSHNGH